VLVKQHDDNTDQEMSDNNSKDPWESPLSSDIEDCILDNQQEILLLDQAQGDKTWQTSRAPLSMKRTRADTVITLTSMPNLWHPAGAMAPLLLKWQK
jgi:hypothetical protein